MSRVNIYFDVKTRKLWYMELGLIIMVVLGNFPSTAVSHLILLTAKNAKSLRRDAKKLCGKNKRKVNSYFLLIKQIKVYFAKIEVILNNQ